MKISGNSDYDYSRKLYAHGDLLVMSETASGIPLYIYFYKVSK